MSCGFLVFVAAVTLSSVRGAHVGGGAGQLRGEHPGHHGDGRCTEVLHMLQSGEIVEDCDYTAETLPQCDQRGNFNGKQCHALTQEEVGEKWCIGDQQGDECFHSSKDGRVFKVEAGVEWCVCVDPYSGHWNKSTATPASEELKCHELHYGPCQEMLWKIEAGEPVEHDDFRHGMVPDCDEHGYFKPKQCHAFHANDTWCEDGETGDDCYTFSEGEEWCICVDHMTGHCDKHTATPAELDLYCGKCHDMLWKIEHGEPIHHPDYQPGFMPVCNEFGNFEPQQCHTFSYGDRWCDDHDPDFCYYFDEGEAWCICVDPQTGHMDKSSPAPAGDNMHCGMHSGMCAKWHWMLMNNKTKKHGDFRDDFIPDCDEDGNFKPKQCHKFNDGDVWCDETGYCHHFDHGGVEWCICMDPLTGHTDPTTMTNHGPDLYCGLQTQLCHYYLEKLKSNKTRYGDFRDDFVPLCDADGNFAPKQCHMFKDGDKYCEKGDPHNCYYFKDGEVWCACMDPITGEIDESTVTEGKHEHEMHCGGEPEPPPEPRCPKDWTLFSEHGHEHCFIFISTPKTWVDAELACQWDHAHLASVTCPETQHFLQVLSKGENYEFPPTWIGGTNAVQSCFWMWSNGDFFKYENFHKESAKLREDSCLQLNNGCGGDMFKWGSGCCNETLPFICGKPPGQDMDKYKDKYKDKYHHKYHH